jgi:VWFA-related protein
MVETKLRFRSSMIVIAAAIAILSGNFGTAPAQPQQSLQPGGRQAEMVTVPVVLRGKNGQVINNLSSDQFHIFEGGKEQQIALFSPSDQQPLSMGLLMQWSHVRRYELPYGEIGPASQFFRSLMHDHDAAFVARFSDNVTPLSDFVEDPNLIAQSLQQASRAAVDGRTGLYDAIIWACQEKFLPRSGRKVLLLVTSGIDGTGTDAEVAARRSEALKSALQAQTAVYFIQIADTNSYIQNSHLGREVAVVAEQTGGDVFYVRNQSDLSAAFDLVATDLRSGYVLGYYSSNLKRDDKFRRVSVRSSDKTVHVQAPSGYYASTK